MVNVQMLCLRWLISLLTEAIRIENIQSSQNIIEHDCVGGSWISYRKQSVITLFNLLESYVLESIKGSKLILGC